MPSIFKTLFPKIDETICYKYRSKASNGSENIAKMANDEATTLHIFVRYLYLVVMLYSGLCNTAHLDLGGSTHWDLNKPFDI